MDQFESNDYYPSQINETIGNVTFNSQFDSGNLRSVRRDSYNRYLLTISNDQGINNKTTNYKTWFYFSVQGIDSDSIVSFVITNMQNQMGLFKDGMQPVFRNDFSNEWQRVKFPCAYRLVPEGYFELTFKHAFTSSQRVFFAFSYPWSCQDSEFFINQLEIQARTLIKDIYFKTNTLVNSKEGRKIYLLTITTNNSVSTKIEEPIQNLFPIQGEGRPLIFKKKYIFVSARVHPGEVPGSFVLNGILKFLLNQNEKAAQIARDQFVWVIVPIINPDGVYRGHYRTDSYCQNLNRYYINPSFNDHPSIYAIKEYIMRLHNTDRLYIYLDLHAHAGHKGIFIYGNQLPNLFMHTQSCLLPRLITLYSEIFDYDGCNFTEKNMYAADKGDGLSKEGSGRVALYKATNIVHSYTLECNYNTGKYINIINKEIYTNPEDIANTYGSEQLDDQIILNTLPPQTSPNTYFYTIYDYEQVGKGIVMAILDINLINPTSKLPESYFKTLPNLKSFLAYNITKTMPFRFEPYLRKVLKNINNKEQIPRTLKAFYDFISTNQIRDSLENEQVQTKPLTRYQKAQEIKQAKLMKQSIQKSVAEVPIKKQIEPLQKKPIQQVDSLPIKQYAFSEFDLERNQPRRNGSMGKIRAKSEGKNANQQIGSKPIKQFKIKKQVRAMMNNNNIH